MRRTVLIATVVLGIAVLTAVGLGLVSTPGTDAVAPEEPTDDERQELVGFEDHESGIWPYLNAEPTFEKRSPINVFVEGDSDRIVRLLQEDGRGNWNETPEEERETDEEYAARDVRLNATGIGWGDATGTARYAYVHDGEEGQWVRETTHLHDGTYYGHRHHMRLYESPHEEEDWVAIQAHSEHFDWFTLRHSVHGVQGAQVYVEEDLRDNPAVDRLWREHVGNDGASDSDGWGTFVTLSAVLSLLGVGGVGLDRVWNSHLTPVDRRRILAVRERITARLLALGGTIVALLLGVRFGGIAMEVYTESLSMHTIALTLYPIMAIGIPIATYALAAGIERRMDAAVTASVAMAAAILLDYGYVGVDVIPVEIILHRTGVILAIGLIAGGAAERATRETHFNGLVVGGAALWIAVLGVALLEIV